jgi:hypothetical protein
MGFYVLGGIAVIAGAAISTIGFNENNKTTIPFFTTESVSGKTIVRSLGTVEAQSNPLAGPGVAQSSAKKTLEKEAIKMGANAIVGFRTERNESESNLTYYPNFPAKL